MTEITATTVHNVPPVRYGALMLSLILGPMFVTVLTFWAFIPVVALILGGPLYFLAGLPVLAVWLDRFGPNPVGVALVALMTNSLICGAGIAVFQLGDEWQAARLARLYLNFGAVFAPLWGFATGAVYACITSRPAHPQKESHR